MHAGKLTIPILLVCATSTCLGQEPGWLQAKALPSRDLTLSFTRPGTIRQVLVTEGQSVSQGQVLVQLDDSIEQIQLQQAQAEAEDDTRLQAAKARLEQARIDLRKTRKAAQGGGATATEVEHAQLEVTIHELSLKLARLQQDQARRKVQEIRQQIERMRIRSETDGRVEKVHLRPGESADALQEVIRVVRVDPLWVEVDVPVAQARYLSPAPAKGPVGPEHGARVRIGSPKAKPVPGRIVYKAAVGDAPSGTLRVRIEVPNKALCPAGQFCWVQLPKTD